MEISGKVLREVEFRDRLRGYDTDEVDEFLEKVAVAVDELRAALDQANRRAERAERRAEETPAAAPAPALDDDAIRRTLVLAQRTADMAVAEARDEAARIVDEARGKAEALISEAELDVHSRLVRLEEERELLERSLQTLGRLVESERARLGEALRSALRVVEETLTSSEEAAEYETTLAAARRPAGPEASRGETVDEDSFPSASAPGVAAGAGEATAMFPITEERSELASAAGDPRGAGAIAGDLVPDVEHEIAEDAATASGGARSSVVASPRPRASEDDDGEEELWERWAAGRDLGVVPGPADFPLPERRFGRDPGGGISA